MGLNPIVALARVLAHEVPRVKELAERRLRVKAPNTPDSSDASLLMGSIN